MSGPLVNGPVSDAGMSRLAALVASCASAGVARQALLLRFDQLPPSLSRPHHVRLVEAALAPLLRLPRAELFHLPGQRIAVAWRGDAESELLDVIDALEHLLQDPGADSPSLSGLLGLYDLPEAGDLLIETLVGETSSATAGPTGPAIPLDPSFLTLLEACLSQADVARFARRQSVWQMDGTRTTLVWEDRTLCTEDIGEELAPGYDIQAEPWLFRRLTRTLDRRLLALLASPGELAAARPFSIGLNIASLMSADFLRFDAALPAALRGRVVLALSPADIVADARSVRFATGFARERGYRLLLNTDTADLLGVLTPAASEFDYVAIPWAATLPSREQAIFPGPMPDGLLLSGCDTPAAITWGLAKGVQLFMGPAATEAAVV